MNIIKPTFLLLLLCNSLCFAQTLSGTFQGEIAGRAPIFLHLEAEDGVVTGYYIYPSDKVLASLPLKGSIDKNGNVELANSEKPFPAFSGKLQNRIIRGSFKTSEKEKPENFYAVDFTGKYKNSCDNSTQLSFNLSHKGYMLRYWPEDYSYPKECLITTHIEPDGRIYLRCDSLNSKLYPKNDTWVLDNKSDTSSIIYQNVKQKECKDKFVFKLTKSETTEGMPEENPEKRGRFPDVMKVKLNNNYSIRLRKISKSEYIVRMFRSAHLRHSPYKEIKDIAEAQKMLEGRFKTLTGSHAYEIIFKDKTKIIIEEADFIAYYPEVEVLFFSGEHESDYPLDLNDGAKEHVGNPQDHVLSPDKQFLLNGYYHGQDCRVRFLEKWNKSKKKYETIGFLANIGFYLNGNGSNTANDANENPGIDFCYADGWFWTSSRKVLFEADYNDPVGNKFFYEMEVIEHRPNESSP